MTFYFYLLIAFVFGVAFGPSLFKLVINWHNHKWDMWETSEGIDSNGCKRLLQIRKCCKCGYKEIEAVSFPKK